MSAYIIARVIGHADNHVDILDGLAPTTQAARDLHTYDPRDAGESLLNSLRLLLRVGIEMAISVLRQERDTLQDFFFRFLAKTRQDRDLIAWHASPAHPTN